MINHYYKHTYKYIYSFITALFLSFFFIPSTSHAAPSDCIQLSSDGQLPCTVAKSKFQYYVSNAPFTDTFEDSVIAWKNSACSFSGGQK